MPDSTEEKISPEVIWDRKLRLDHILTWLVTGAAAGVVSALVWIQSVDHRLYAVEIEQLHQRERDAKQDATLAEAITSLKEQMKAVREDVKEIAKLLTSRGSK